MFIELAQLSGIDADTHSNTQSALAAIEKCQPETKLIVFPETHLMGFPTAQNVASLAEPLDGPALSAIQKAATAKNVSVVIGMAEALDGRYYNSTSLITPEGIALTYRKTHLWASDKGIFDTGNKFVSCMWHGIRVGILICFDIEFPESARALGAMDVDLLIVTNGNMDPYGPVHSTAIKGRAMENQMFAVMTNRCGAGTNMVFAGESALVDPFGNMLAVCGRESEQLQVKLDLSLLQKSREAYSYLNERRVQLEGSIQELSNGVREYLIK